MRSDPPITSPKERESEADLNSNRSQSKRRVRSCSVNSHTSTSSHGSRSSSVRSTSTSSRGSHKKSSSKKNNSNSKKYDAHIPVFPNLQRPTNIVLEPFPNRRVRSMCSAGGLLITAHRNGIRIYRQRYLTPAAVAALANSRTNMRKQTDDKNRNSNIAHIDVRTGIWESVEFRDNFHLQDAYLCVGAECVFSRGRVLPLKWNRYFAAACGSDRTRFSVCVMSVAAHFVLHHELHAKNKVVALNFALVAMEAKADSRRYQPFVISVDEVGEVVIFDVERDRAVKLTLAPSLAAAPFSLSDSFNGESCRNNCSPESSDTTPIHNDGNRKNEKKTNNMYANNTNGTHLSPTLESIESKNINGMPLLYRLETGLASNVCLVGPCQVLCRYCDNVGVHDSVSGNGNNNNSSNSNSTGVHHTLPLSLFIASHAHSFGGSTAELHVTQLRVYYTPVPLRAVVRGITPIVREGVTESLCDPCVALLRLPFHTMERPPTILLARPRLRFWSLSGCSGKLLQLHRVYDDTDGSGMGARTPREHFVQVVPLGRHTLRQDVNTSWLCIAALTDDDVILLLGQQPRTLQGEKMDRNNNNNNNNNNNTGETAVAAPTMERQALEAWLRDTEESEKKNNNDDNNNKEEEDDNKKIISPKNSTLSCLEEKKSGEEEHLRDNSGGVEGEKCSKVLMPVSPPLTFMDPKEDYTVLMLLTPPCRDELISPRTTSPSTTSLFPSKTITTKTKTTGTTTSSPLSPDHKYGFTRQLISVPQSNELLFSCDGSEEIYSIKLPFVWDLAPVETTTHRTPIPIPQNESNNTRDGWRSVSLAAGYLRDLNIARPLMAAVWNLAGEVEPDESSLPPVVVQPQQEEEDHNNDENSQEQEGEEKPYQEEKMSSLEVVEVTSERTTGSLFPSRAAVPVHIADMSKVDGIDGINGVRSNSPGIHIGRKKKRRSRSSSVVSMEERISSVNDYDDDNDNDLRRAYVKNEQQKFLDTPKWRKRQNSSDLETSDNNNNDNNNNNLMSGKDGIEGNSTSDAALLIQMVTMDEPLQRNAILYEWSDEHDNLYVQFTEEALEIIEKEKAREAAVIAESQTTLLQTSHSLRDQPIIMLEIRKGNQSAGFMQAFRHAQQKRQQLRDRGGTFDFTSYFTTNVVPQRLLDLQEDDRCRFELADIKAAFEDEMREMREVETVVVYENEEREVDTSGRRRWRPHLTFRFDDLNGEVVDIAMLNATATIRKGNTPSTTNTNTTNNNNNNNNNNTNTSSTISIGATMSSPNTPGNTGWRWADGITTRPSGSRLVRKELHSWRVGEWMYAARWPTREEEQTGTFEWKTAVDCVDAKVRRRRLSRDRINIALEAAKEQRRREYMKKEEELRMELGL